MDKKKESLINYFKQLTPEQKMKMVPELGRFAAKLRQGVKKTGKNERPDN
ncbi:hypothetical protein [Moorella sulfitireducens (nom. illeg.)]|nr:hypothetical protein [Moorella sulfitireducens]